jgi:oligopeptide transport system permease protein
VPFNRELFEPLVRDTTEAEKIAAPATTYWGGAWRRLKQNRLAMVGLVVIALLAMMALFGPYLTGYSYSDQNLNLVNRPPGAAHWFGTDSLGRDLFTRIWYGARISLAIGLVTSLICLALGVTYGGISGYVGGRLDEVMMRFVEVLYALPFLLYVILLMVFLGPGLKAIFIALGISSWLTMARVVRGQVLSLKEQEYVLAARTLGAGPWRILFRHLIPNAMGPIIVVMTFTIPEAIFTEAFLSFLGLGVAVPMASWGYLANEGANAIPSYPWQLLFPAFFISITMLAFNFLGNGLRDALDPRLRG